jgi:hypothetical protein
MTATGSAQESARDRNERLFLSLPKLWSSEYMLLLKQATAAELPAPVLVRAYQQLGQGPAADATLARLLASDEQYGYLRPLRAKARRMVSHRDWFDTDILVDEAIGEIVLALPGPRGVGAHNHWISFLHQRLIDAYRALNGRRGTRQDPPRVDPREDPETGLHLDPVDLAEDGAAPWHGRVQANDLEWLEEFIERTLRTIVDQRIREVALDLFSAEPSPISGTGDDGQPSLTERFQVDRYTIYRWRKIARTKLLVALREQDERDIDVSWLEMPPDDK